jgi:hypothetical protein
MIISKSIKISNGEESMKGVVTHVKVSLPIVPGVVYYSGD